MSYKGKLKSNGPPGVGLAVPRAQVKLSPRAKWKRALKKMDKAYDPDVDVESVPMTERESLSRQNSLITSGRNSAHPSPSRIPNVVQYDTRETVVGKDSDGLKQEILDDTALRESGNSGQENIASIGRNKLNNEANDGDNAGTVIVDIKGRNGSPNMNGSVVNSETRVPLSRLGNDIPLKESLTVPGSDTSQSSVAKDADGNRRKSSILSFGRETSKFSLDSRKSSDARMNQFTAINMPAGEEKGKSSMFSPEDSWIKTVIPYMPLGVAVTCLVMNIIIPGSGTILSGATVFCCGKSRVPQKYEQDAIFVMCLNTFVGVAQLFTVTFMLVGWFWSVAWGITMIILSLERRREMKEEREKELKRRALQAFGTTIPGRIAPFS